MTRRQFALFLIALITVPACGRSAITTTVSRSQAYTDGFEAVVYDLHDGVVTNVRSVVLKAAEEALATGSEALIPAEHDPIRKPLQTRGGDTGFSMEVKRRSETAQRVRMTFREGDRLYTYEYDIDGKQLTPVGSEFRDFTKREITLYN